MAARPDPELLEREIEAKMIRWMEQRGVTVVFHSSPPISERRWIGVVTTGGLYSDPLPSHEWAGLLVRPRESAPTA